MKKVISNLLAVTLAVSTFSMAGCKKAEPENAGDTSAAVKPEERLEIKWLGYPTSGLYPEENSYIVEELEKRFNIDLKIIKGDSSKDQELNMVFASGEIPDHFLVNANYVDRVISEGLARDIPEDMLKTVAPNFLKSIEKYHPASKQMSIYKNGSFIALPEGKGELFPMTVIRTDWLKKVGAKIPTNLNEYEEICRLFTMADPDGDGKNNTYGLFLTSSYENVQAVAATFGLALSGGTIKNDSWVKDASGSLVKAQVSDNFKNFVKYLANLYKKGYVYPDVTVKNANDLFSNGVVGIKTGSWTAVLPKYRPSEWYAMTFKKNPNATAEYMSPLKGLKGEEPVYEREASVWRYACIGKDTSDAKTKKILEIIEAQMTDMDVHNLVWRGKEGTHYTRDEEGMAILTNEYTSTEKQAEVGIKFFIANFRNEEQSILSHGKGGKEIEEFQKDWKAQNQLIPSGTVMSSQKEFGADIKKIEQEFYINAVTGTWDVDKEWDKYIKRWNEAGGQKITAEANEIYKKYKK